MKLLGIETSQAVSVAYRDTEIDKSHMIATENTRKASETIIENIQTLLKEVDVNIHEIDGVAVGIGPGSYTGTRIGVATAKGLIQGMSKPVVGVSSFDSLKAMVASETSTIPLIDAKNNRVYFEYRGNHGAKDISELLKEIDDDDYVFVGTGAKAYKPLISDVFGEQAKFINENSVTATDVINASLSKFDSNQVDHAISLKPLYISQPNIGKVENPILKLN